MRFKNTNATHDLSLSIEVPQNDQWINIKPNLLTIPPNSQKDVTVTAEPKGKAYGSYTSKVSLNLTSNGNPFTDNLLVNMVVNNPSAPSLTTNSATPAQTSAVITCTLTNTGNSTVTQKGICWSGAHARP